MWTRLRAVVSRLTFIVARRRVDQDVRLEIDAHLEALTEHYRRQGMSPDEAYLAARRQFGNIVSLRQDIHELNSIAWIEHTFQDVRHALRQLACSPAFTGVVVLTLALGIGSTTAIFCVVDAVLLRPLPYRESDRIVRIIERPAESANDIGYRQSLAAVWTRDVPVLRAQAPTLSHVGVYSSATATVTINPMGMTIVAGRSLRRTDERAVLMNETLARSGFLGPQALGQQVFVARHPDPFEVVGIVRDVRQYGLDQDPDPQVFVDARQLPPGNPTPYFAVRVDGDPTSYVSSVREAVREIDSSAVLDQVATMQQVVSNSLSRPRLFAVLAATFAIVGALLAAIGVYGVTAYAVTQRTRELAIRLALGARPLELLALVMRQGAAWTIVGLILGVIGSVALSRYLQGVLFGITPADPTTFAVVSATFLAVALLATLIPARRVTRVDPLVALRTP